MVSRYEIVRRENGAWKRMTVSTMTELALPAAKVPAAEYAVRAIDVEGNASEPSKPAALRPERAITPR